MRNRFFYNLGLLARRPFVILRVIENYLLIFFGRHRLRSVEIDLGYECQLNCKHCYAANLINPKKKVMSLDQVKSVIDQCIDEGAIHFLISGGEPLIQNHVFEVIRYINKKNAFSCLATNGIALTDKAISNLIRSNLVILQISLDSSLRNQHDQNRGSSGLYDKILKAASICRKKGMIVFYSSVITNENLYNGDLKKIINLAKENNIKNDFCFPVAMGAWAGNSVLLSKKNRLKAKIFLKEQDIRCCEEGNYLKEGCSAGIEKICINPYGDILPCPYIQVTFGNITKERLTSILIKMRRNHYFNRIRGYCLPAFNDEFIKEVMEKINESEETPMDMSR